MYTTPKPHHTNPRRCPTRNWLPGTKWGLNSCHLRVERYFPWPTQWGLGLLFQARRLYTRSQRFIRELLLTDWIEKNFTYQSKGTYSNHVWSVASRSLFLTKIVHVLGPVHKNLSRKHRYKSWLFPVTKDTAFRPCLHHNEICCDIVSS